MNIKKLFIIPVFLLLLAGCTGADLTKENASLLVTDFLEDFRKGDYDGMYACTHDGYTYFNGIYNPESQSNANMFNALGQNMEYRIKSVSVHGKEADVTVYVKNCDTAQVLRDVTATYISACEQDTENQLDKDELLAETTKFCFSRADNPTVEHDTVFNLIEKDGKWAIQSNIMIYDDITGGYMTYVYKNVVFPDLLGDANKQKE